MPSCIDAWNVTNGKVIVQQLLESHLNQLVKLLLETSLLLMSKTTTCLAQTLHTDIIANVICCTFCHTVDVTQ
jgi:hypothetical protein